MQRLIFCSYLSIEGSAKEINGGVSEELQKLHLRDEKEE
jgi:hypothetical protein